MTQVESLGIKRIESVHYYVRNLEPYRRLFVDTLDFREVGGDSPQVAERNKQQTAVFRAGDVQLLLTAPLANDSVAGRWLTRHPDGVGALVFEVKDAKKAFALLESRGGTPLADLESFEGEGGTLRQFTLATPFGDSVFRFVERQGYRPVYPGFQPVARLNAGGNRFGFGHVDHITSNFKTMAPALLWMEHVLGFTRFWDIKFHTNDVAPARQTGSGLKSVVYKDPSSDVKFANNEPWRPFFEHSQINLFIEDHRGDGIQHAAIAVPDLVTAVRALRANGAPFMPTPGTYYDALPKRLKETTVGEIDEPIDTLRELEILVDGAAKHQYMLQIFMQEFASIHREPSAGPFFFELIQRKGDQGFGGGNFRALFESIERAQVAQGRI
jgi:4-hydroxyphenylpyruvate dioxygenase